MSVHTSRPPFGDRTDGGPSAQTSGSRLRVVLVDMDVNMPVMSGVEATRVITRRHPTVKVVAFTAADPSGARQMTDAGAAACFDKKAPVSGLIDYIIAEARSRRD